MKVRDVKSRGLVTIHPTSSIAEVTRLIFKKDIKALPVIDAKKRLLGIITRENLLEKVYPDYKKLFEAGDSFPDFEDLEDEVGDKLKNITVETIMTKRVIYTYDDTPVLRALSRMIVRRVNQLPVLSRNGILIGIVTKGDIFYTLFKQSKKK